MSHNPFAAPEKSFTPAASPARAMWDLLFIARCHKFGLILWVMNLLLLPGLVYWFVPFDIYIHDEYFFSLSPDVELWVSLIFFFLLCPVWLVSLLLVAVLATRVFHAGVGLLFGVLCIIPGATLLLMPVTFRGAANLLRMSGFEVGLLGANLADIHAAVAFIDDSKNDE